MLSGNNILYFYIDFLHCFNPVIQQSIGNSVTIKILMKQQKCIITNERNPLIFFPKQRI